jgi:hypothetical protein
MVERIRSARLGGARNVIVLIHSTIGWSGSELEATSMVMRYSRRRRREDNEDDRWGRGVSEGRRRKRARWRYAELLGQPMQEGGEK